MESTDKLALSSTADSRLVEGVGVVAGAVRNPPERISMELSNALKVQQFLQLDHVHCFSVDYVAWYLQISKAEVRAICEKLITDGLAYHPKDTSYVQGVPVNWPAVHAGEAKMPEWVKP